MAAVTSILALGALLTPSPTPTAGDAVAAALERAGANRAQLEEAIAQAPPEQREGMSWLVAHMPDSDLESLTSEFLLENCAEAYAAWEAAPWREQVSIGLFFDSVLPYASVNEKRDRWRADFRERFTPLVADAKTISEAAAILNNKVFPAVGVKYSTKRNRADQGPVESMETGLASCTGLSILLIDACRSVGIPARFVGTPLWSDGSGNHSWVEIWDGGWHFTGAAEPSGMDLNKAWFTGRASKASREDPQTAIYAVTWRNSPIHFPLVWNPDDESVRAVDVTDRYTVSPEPLPEGHAWVRFRVLDEGTRERITARFGVQSEDGEVVFRAASRDERFDSNDHVTTTLPLGKTFTMRVRTPQASQSVEFEVNEEEVLVTAVLPSAPKRD